MQQYEFYNLHFGTPRYKIVEVIFFMRRGIMYTVVILKNMKHEDSYHIMGW